MTSKTDDTTQMKHTLGPWIVEAERDGILVTSKVPGLCVSVTIPGRKPTREDKANARLIAAAPDLLFALQHFVASHIALVNSGDCGNWDADMDGEIIMARAALAKAGAK